MPLATTGPPEAAEPPRAGTPFTVANSCALSNSQSNWPVRDEAARIIPSRAPDSSTPGISVTAPTTPR